jgi:hypothetical protein
MSARYILPQKIDPCIDSGAHKGHSFPDKERIFANFRVVALIAVQNGPDRFMQDAKNLYTHKTRLFENGGISALRQTKTPEHAVTKKLEGGPDKIPLPPLAAPAQGAVGSEKSNVVSCKQLPSRRVRNQ